MSRASCVPDCGNRGSVNVEMHQCTMYYNVYIFATLQLQEQCAALHCICAAPHPDMLWKCDRHAIHII
eukprot:7388181-Heterocapsa_arctica.AAC.1